MTALENATRDGFSLEAGTTVMPVKCTGLVKVSFLLKLFARGIEGVLVLGCHEGDCHYYNGSERCARIVDETREIISLAGIPARRLGFDLIAESGGKELVRALTSFGRQFGGKKGRKTATQKRALKKKAVKKKASGKKAASKEAVAKKAVKKKVARKKPVRKKAAGKSTVRRKRGV
jgi:coenzyme F420-reducing hydrogenase delta subunit